MTRLREARLEDAEEIARLRNAAVDALTARLDNGHGSGHATTQGVEHRMRQGAVYIARTRVRLQGSRPCKLPPSAPSSTTNGSSGPDRGPMNH